MRRFRLGFLWVLGAASLGAADDPGFIRDWLVLGSFPTGDEATILSTPYVDDEPGAAPAAGDTMSGRTWRPAEPTSRGCLDFHRSGFDRVERAVAYAHVYVHAEREQNVTLLVGSDDGVKIWVNGRVAHEHLVWRGWKPDQDKVLARLGRGWNRILFKVNNGSGGFNLSARVVAEGGLRFAANRPVPAGSLPTPDVGPWVVIDSIRPGPRLVVESGRFTWPVDLAARNLGTRDPGPVSARLAVGHAAGSSTLERVFEIRTGSDRVDLDAETIAALARRGAVADLTVRWADREDPRPLPIGPQETLDALIATRDDAMPPALVETLDYLESNLRWARVFFADWDGVEAPFAERLASPFLARDWATAGRAAGALAETIRARAPAVKKDVIAFTGNAHIDMAWLWNYDETIQVCYETFASALDFAREDPKFVYAQSQAQSYAWMEERFPALFDRIREAAQTGSWEVVGGMWVEPDLNVPSGEALVRQILLGKRWFRDKLGVDVRVGYNPDSFGYCASLPQILKKSGIDYFVTQKIGWNDTNVFPHRLFWWESPDGSRVLTFFPHTYVHDADPERTAREFLEFKAASGTGRQLVLYGVGNHGGGPTRANLERIRAMQRLDAFPTVRQTSTLDFMRSVEAAPEALRYPVWRDELYLEYHRGTYTTQAAVKRANRRAEILLEEAEKYAVLAGIVWPSDELREAWRLTLFNQFHDILPGSGIGPIYDDAKAQHAFAHALAGRIIDASLARIASSIGFPGEGLPLVVFNPLSWTRTGLVRAAPPPGWSDAMGLYDGDGREIPYEARDGALVFEARSVPSIGYATWYLREPRRAPPEPTLIVDGTRIENEFLRVTVDPKSGHITSIVDKTLGREVLESGRPGNVLTIFEDLPEQWDAWDIGYTGRSWTLDEVSRISVAADGPYEAALRIERTFGKSAIVQDLTLRAGGRQLDVVTRVDWHEDHKLLKAAFPVVARDAFATYEIPYGTIRRATVPRNSFDEAKWEVPGHRWIDLSDPDARWGVSLLNDSKYGFDVRQSTMRITLLRSPKYPDPQADMGEHEFTYSIYPHAGDWREGETFRRAYELNVPLRAVAGSRGGGSRPERAALAATDAPGVMITAVKRAEDSDDIVIRLLETHGRAVDARVTVPPEAARARASDLMERPLGNLEIRGPTVTVPLGPWAIETLLVTPKGKP